MKPETKRKIGLAVIAACVIGLLAYAFWPSKKVDAGNAGGESVDGESQTTDVQQAASGEGSGLTGSGENTSQRPVIPDSARETNEQVTTPSSRPIQSGTEIVGMPHQQGSTR